MEAEDAEGLYRVEVLGTGGVGDFTLHTYYNAALDDDFGSVTCDDMATALSIDDAFVDLDAQVGLATVVGRVRNTAEDFESGDFRFDWTTLYDDYSYDMYRMDLEAGESISVILDEFIRRGADLELLDETGALVAVPDLRPGDAEAAIADLIASADGTYYLRIAGNDTGVDYTVTVIRNAAADLEPNSSRPGAIDLSTTGQAAGWVGNLDQRLYVYDRHDDPRILRVDWEAESAEQIFPGRTAFNSHHTGSDLALAASARRLFVGGGARSGESPRLYVYDSQTSAFVDMVELDLDGLRSLTWFEGELYAVDADGSYDIAVIDPETGGVTRRYPNTVSVPKWIDYRGELIGYNSNRMYSFDPRTGEIAQRDDLPTIYSYKGTVIDERLFYQDYYHEGFEVYSLESGEPTLLKTVTYAGDDYLYVSGLGRYVEPVEDWYRVRVHDGDTVSLATRTPEAVRPGDDVWLDPTIELVAPDGTVLATDDNGAADGRNAVLAWTAGADGELFVRVTAAGATEGGYVLSVDGATPTPDPAPRVVSTDPVDGVLIETAPTEMTVTFSETIDLSTLEPADVRIGGQPMTGYRALDGRTMVFELPAILAGEHAIAIDAGAFTDLQGRPVEAYATSFTVGRFDMPTPLNAVEPYGSQVYEGSVTGAIAPVGDTNTFAIELDAGQTLTALVDPLESGLRPSIAVYAPDGAVLASVEAPGVATMALAQGMDIDTPGRYRLEVGGLDGSTGEFRLRLVLNAGFEEEAFGGSTNDSIDRAQPLEDLFRTVGGAERLSLIGRLRRENSRLVASEHFETETVPAGWSLYASNYGEADIGDRSPSADGEGCLLLATQRDHGYQRAEATWTVDLSDLANPALRFWTSGVLHNPLPAVFTGHTTGTGVAISVDGNTWYGAPVYSPSDHPSNARYNLVDIGRLAEAHGLDIEGPVRIRFQVNADNAGIARNFDDVRLYDSVDLYTLNLEAGTPVDVILNPFVAAPDRLKLIDPSGRVVATGASGGNGALQIGGFTPDDSGAYTLRIVGAPDHDYHLAVTRNGHLLSPGYDTPSEGPVLSGPDTLYGAVRPLPPVLSEETEPNDFFNGSFLGSDHRPTDLTGSFEHAWGNTYRVKVFERLAEEPPYVDIYKILASPGDRHSESVEFLLDTDTPVQPATDAVFTLDAIAGGGIELTTATPAAGSGAFVNDLDPTVAVYDPAGNRVAFDDNGAGDGRNAHILFSPRSTGRYTVRIGGTPDGAFGEFVLQTAVSGPADTPMWVTATMPDDGATLATPPGHYAVTFSHEIDPDSVEPTDMLLDGAPAASAVPIDPYTVLFEFDGPLHDGAHIERSGCMVGRKRRARPGSPRRLQRRWRSQWTRHRRVQAATGLPMRITLDSLDTACHSEGRPAWRYPFL